MRGAVYEGVGGPRYNVRMLDFLSPALAALLADDAPPAPTDVAVLRASRSAMATVFEVLLPFGNPVAQPAAEAALDRIDELEDQLTVYRETSEVSRLNATAADGPVELEPGLFDLIAFAAGVTRQTHGAFDIGTGALIKAWGFYRRQGRVPTPAERAAALARTGTRFLALDPDRGTVKFLRRGLEINLGGIGKGYALDRAADLLRTEWGIASALLNGGSSSVRTVGTPPGQPRGWPVALRHPWDPGRGLGTLFLSDAALGTSAATYQHFEYNGRRLGHLLDPRLGWPAAGVEQVSVVAPTAAEADALSTAFFVLGPAATARVCRSRPDIGVVMLAAAADRPVLFNLTPATFSPRVP